MGRVLITGATGFIGRNLAAYLGEQNVEVVAWGRRPTSAEHYRSGHVEIQTGNWTQAAEFVQRSHDISAVVHLAAIVAPYSKKETWRVNVEETRQFARECSQRSNPPVFIYVSSLSASGPCIQNIPRRESDACSPRSLYGQSKSAAESELRGLANSLPISIVRPPAVFGPMDQNLLQMFHSIRMKINLIGISASFRYSFIHSADLVRGIHRVLTNGKRLKTPSDPPPHPHEGPQGVSEVDPEGTYFLADSQPITFVELGNMVARSMDLADPFHIALPSPVCWPVAAVSDVMGRYLKVRTFLNLDKMREAVSGSWVCDTTQAEQELGFTVSEPLDIRVQQTADWYHANGLIGNTRKHS